VLASQLKLLSDSVGFVRLLGTASQSASCFLPQPAVHSRAGASAQKAACTLQQSILSELEACRVARQVV
jgi:hypothetical protein